MNKTNFKHINELSFELQKNFYSFIKEYLPDADESKIISRQNDFYKCYLAIVEDNKILGICFGWPRALDFPEDKTFILKMDINLANTKYGRKMVQKQ